MPFGKAICSCAWSGRWNPNDGIAVFKMLDASIKSNPPTLLNARELAFILGISNRSLCNYVNRGLLPRIKLGRRVLYRWSQVESALAKIEKAEVPR